MVTHMPQHIARTLTNNNTSAHLMRSVTKQEIATCVNLLSNDHIFISVGSGVIISGSQ